MISAILPAYNVEKYLGQCIDSILSQSVECEIIIINDGSTDNTLQVAQNYAQKYNNITVLTQENSGQSVARNRGIEIAKGDYLLLLDSDDYLIENTLKNLYNICLENNLDYIKTGYRTFNDKDGKVLFSSMPTNKTINNVVTAKQYFLEVLNHGYNVVMSAGLYKMQYVKENNIKYLEGIQYEDNTYSLNMCLADLEAKAMQTDIYFVMVRLHEGTTTSSKPKLKKIEDILKNVEKMNEFISTLDADIQGQARKTVSSLVFAMSSLYFRLSRKDRKLANKIIPKKVLKDSITYSYDSFQKKKLIAFTYFKPLLSLYNITIRNLVVKMRNRGKNG